MASAPFCVHGGDQGNCGILKKHRKSIENQLFARSVLGVKNTSFANSCEENVIFFKNGVGNFFLELGAAKYIGFSKEKYKGK